MGTILGLAALVLGIGTGLNQQASSAVESSANKAMNTRQTSLTAAMADPRQAKKPAIGASVRVGEKQLRKKRVPALVRREKVDRLRTSGKAEPRQVFTRESARNGGCNPAYGEQGQCLPTVVPHALRDHGRRSAATTWTCDSARVVFPDGLQLRAEADPLRLDLNGDRVACGPGDH